MTVGDTNEMIEKYSFGGRRKAAKKGAKKRARGKMQKADINDTIAKYNPNHGKDGRFTSGSGGGGGSKTRKGAARRTKAYKEKMAAEDAARAKMPQGNVGLTPGRHKVGNVVVHSTEMNSGGAHRAKNYRSKMGNASAWTNIRTGEHHAEFEMGRQAELSHKKYKTASSAHKAAIRAVATGRAPS